MQTFGVGVISFEDQRPYCRSNYN